MAQKSLSSTKVHKPSKASSSTSKQLIKKTKELENEIKLSQNQNLNPIADLVEALTSFINGQLACSNQAIHTLIYSLHRIFSSLIRQGRIHASPVEVGPSEAVKVVREWLKTRYNEYVDGLLWLLRYEGEEGSQIELDCLTILMNLVRSESDVMRSLKAIDHGRNSAGGDIKYPMGGFESTTFRKLVKNLLVHSEAHQREIRTPVRAEFILRYLNFCDDLRYHFLKSAALICDSYNPASSKSINSKSQTAINDPDSKDSRCLTKNLLIYLESLTTMPTEAEELNQFWTGKPVAPPILEKRKSRHNAASSKKPKIEADGSTGIFDDPSESEDSEPPEQPKPSKTHPLLALRAHRKAFSECWIAFLSLQCNEAEVKRVLKLLHDQVIPHMIDPTILMDFLVDCIDYGGSISILALNALFTLMSKHNLDYPAFYTRLYAIMDRTVLHARHRPRFFRMLETFLSSTHLPVNIVASFIKKMARLSLFAPPGAIIAIIPFCYNLIKQHPSCMAMLHRVGQPTTTAATMQTEDPYDVEELDPLKSGAIFSSLWEFASLRSHYLSSVSTLAKVYSEAFDKPKYDLEDFMDHTYSSLLETEFNRQIRKSPALSIFASSYKLTNAAKPLVPDDIVSQMWQM